MSSKKSFSDLKKRLADVYTALVQKADPNAAVVAPVQIRMWLADNKNKLLESFTAISQSDQRMEVDAGAATDNSQGGKCRNTQSVNTDNTVDYYLRGAIY